MDQVAQKALNKYANQQVIKELQSLQRQQALMTTVKAIKFSISYRIKQLKNEAKKDK
ncbi:MAG: hypothetical protein GKR90_26995 [Pseudomonadales bacterium]|nr:hypothetical protein [Pseudomonadales bacterium]